MSENVQAIAEWGADLERLRSSYRRLADSRLPVNLYSAQARAQRRAATLLHGIASGSGWWEELDCRQLADDERGDRTSLLLGGASGGVALSPHTRGLIEAAGTGTLFLTHVEKLPAEARRRMASVFASRYYTPAGDPFPRPVNCRVVVATAKPLRLLAQSYMIEWEVADALGFVALRAESVVKALGARNILDSHPGELAAAS